MTRHVNEPMALEVVGKAIFITGSGRSGTSMMASLLHSFQKVELAFEPPLVRCLLPLIHEMPGSQWRFLFESYMFEDHLIDALAGRHVNLNRQDDSSIWRSKPVAELEDRLNRSHGRADLLPLALQSHVALKIPTLTPYLGALLDYYPNLRNVVMIRNAQPVIASEMRKGWYNDASFEGPAPDWPVRFVDGIRVPHWVADEDAYAYRHMNETERCCYAYNRQYGGLPDHPAVIPVSYELLVAKPRDYVEALAQRLGLTAGPLTQGLIDGIAEPQRDRSVDFSSVDSALLARTLEIQTSLQQRAKNYWQL